MKPTGFIKNPTIVMLQPGPDHENWIEVGEKEEHGLACVMVSYAPKFGWLYSRGWIDEEELEKAKAGKQFKWKRGIISGHMIP